MVEPTDGRTTRYAHRRRELLEAASDWVLERGLGDVALRPLAAALGVSHATLLHHFGSREQLLVEVLGEFRTRQRLLLAATAADAADAAPDELLRAAWRQLTAPDAEPFVRLVFELVGAGLRGDAALEAFLRDVVADWTLSIEAVLAREGVPETRAASLATFIYGGLRGLLLDLVTTGERERLEAGVEELAAAVRALLAAPMGTRST
jgi:AcrR family transcriptional regulator